MIFLKKIVPILIFLMVYTNNVQAVDYDTSSYGSEGPNVRAINKRLKAPLPDIAFIQQQEIEIKNGKLISKKELLNGVRIEEVKLKNIRLDNIRIDKFLGESYYFITIFCDGNEQHVDYAYEERSSDKEIKLDDFKMKSLKNRGKINHFCLSVNSFQDAEDIVGLIIELAGEN